MTSTTLFPRNKREDNHNGNPPVMKPLRQFFRPFTGTSPEITLDPDDGTAFILGRCLTSNPDDFFQPVIDWAREYVQNPQPVTMVIINTDYINTGSAMALRQFLGILSDLQLTGRKVIVKWYCDKQDEDLRELVDMIEEVVRVKIQLEMAE